MAKKTSKSEQEFMQKVQAEVMKVLNKYGCSLQPQALLTPQGLQWNLNLVRNQPGANSGIKKP